jgi:hypothetical protein
MHKLTLSVEKEVAIQAKQLASSTGTSVSAMFSRWIKTLNSQVEANPPLGRLTRQATGVIKMTEEDVDKDILADALQAKYGL